MRAQLPHVPGEVGGPLAVVVGRRGVEVGVQRDLGVDHDPPLADQVHHQVGAAGAVVEADLLGEVAAVDQAGQLDGPAQVQLAPASPDLRLAQRGGQRLRLAAQRLGREAHVLHLLVQLALPAGALVVEVAHLVLQPLEALPHHRLVGGPQRVHLTVVVRRAAPGPQRAERTAEHDPHEQAQQQREHRRHLHGGNDDGDHRQSRGGASARRGVRHNALAMTPPRDRPPAPLRDTSALAIGSAASGLLAYVFFALVTRALGSAAAAPVSVLWAYWSFAGAALTFPLQHWIARSVVAHGGERSVRTALPGVLRWSLLAGVVTFGASWLGRDLLFGSGDLWFPLLVAAVTLASAAMGVVRGVLTARRRFRAVGLGLVSENLLRSAAALALMLAGVHEPVAYGLCLLLGYAAVAAWPSTFRLSRGGTDGDGDSPWVFLAGAGGGQVIGQVVLTGGPVVLALAGGSPAEVTALFAGLALFRAPYTLALGLVSQLTGWFSRLVVRRDTAALRRLRRQVLVLTLVGSAGAALVGALLGPVLLPLVFGEDVTLAAGRTLVLAVGSTVAMANLVVTLMLLALGRTGVLIRAWLLAWLPGVAWFLVAGVPVLDRTCVAFLVVEVAAFGLLVREESRGTAALR